MPIIIVTVQLFLTDKNVIRSEGAINFFELHRYKLKLIMIPSKYVDKKTFFRVTKELKARRKITGKWRGD